MSKPSDSVTVMNPSDETIAEWIAYGYSYKQIGPSLYEVTVSDSETHKPPQDLSIKAMLREIWLEYWWGPVRAVWRWLRRR